MSSIHSPLPDSKEPIGRKIGLVDHPRKQPGELPFGNEHTSPCYINNLSYFDKEQLQIKHCATMKTALCLSFV